MTLTNAELKAVSPEERVALVEQHALAVLALRRPKDAQPLDGTVRLADAGMDSLQVVELKFSLDEVMGCESDVELFIKNPSIHELAVRILKTAGL